MPPHIVLGHVVGKGGSCTAISAVNTDLHTRVVVKIASLKCNQLQREHFILKEYLAECPGVPEIVYFDVVGEYVILVEQPLGTTLENYCLSHSGPVKHYWLEQLVAILKEIHKRGIIHGDIKPSNIIIEDSGNLRIIDFGFAMRIGSSYCGFNGTRDFASQNTLQHRNPSIYDDVESLCYTLFALEIGIHKWNNMVDSSRPTVQQLKKCSLVVSTVWQLYHTHK